MALFDVDDLALYLKTDVDDDSAEIAQRIAASVLEAYLGFDPESFSGTVYLPFDGRGRVRLPVLLDTLTSVTDLDDVELVYTYREGSGYLTLESPWQAYTYDVFGYRTDEVKITYTYSTVPGAIRDAALIIAANAYGPASASGASALGIKSETIGGYSVTYGTSASSDSAGLATYMPLEARLLLMPYRTPVVA